MEIIQNSVKIILNETNLQFSFEHEGTLWTWVEDFRPCITFAATEEQKAQAAETGEPVQLDRVDFADARIITHEPWTTGVGSGIISHFAGFAGPAEGLEFETIVWAELGTGYVRCEWIPLGESARTVQAVYWPSPMAFEEPKASWYTLLNWQQGVLIPNNWPVATTKTSFNGQLGTAGAYMPWFAQVRDGQAYLAIAETPHNAGYDVNHPENGPFTHMNIRWEPSLGRMDYRRVLQYRFLTGDQNTVCKEYRAYAREKGLLRTLNEKAIQNPSINDMVGCSFVHMGIKTKVQPNSDFFDPAAPSKNDHLTPFAVRTAEVKEFKAAGVPKLYLHLDGWAQPGYDNMHPDYGNQPAVAEAGGWEGMRELVDTMHDCGYMFGIHDQYRDYYKAAPSFDENFACRLPGGGIPGHQHWAGGPQSYLCGSQAPYYVKRNFKAIEEAGIKLDGAYLDVFTCNEGDECDHPWHRMTREDCYQYRNACFNFLLSKGILPSSEEVNDWAIPSLVFCHYAPYDFMMNEPGSAKHGIPMPLFNLVYHDCVIEPWMMDKATENEDYMLYALLNAGAPYLRRDAAYPNIDGAFEGVGALSLADHVARCKVVADLHEKVAKCEMVSCELLAEDGSVQRTTFADGTTVTVDFAKQTYEIA